MSGGEVRELRVALTVDDYDGALVFYREALGLPQLEAWEAPEGRVAILDAGRATLELLDAGQAALVDEIEVGRRAAGPVRLALEVADSEAVAERLVRAGAEQLAEPVVTPWRDRNVRLQAPDGMQLTLFTVPDEAAGPSA
jgi:catechol 2,3-dioxygenase-like lactoylglutathione lyase family enzyme